MKNTYVVLAISLVLSASAQKPQSLFDGKTLSGWSGDTNWWKVADGAIVGEIPAGTSLGGNQFLFWDGELHDFELHVSYRISGGPSANSGVQFRSRKAGEGAAGYQADLDDGQVWVGRIYDEHGRGLIVERGTKVIIDATGKRSAEPFREAAAYAALVKKEGWNDYVIKAVGPHIQVTLNGQLTADLVDNQTGEQDFSGKLAVQLHSGPGPAKIEFKDLQLTSLGKTPLPVVALAPTPGRTGLSPKDRNLGFETGSLKGWTTTGDVWGDRPVKGNTVTPRRSGQTSGHDGTYWVGGYESTESDTGQGTLTSEPFEVTHAWGSFLVGGGPHDSTRVDIVEAESGKVLFTASGLEKEDMRVVWVNLSKHKGKNIAVKVVDENAGPWGHVNYDDFRFHAEQTNADPVAQPAPSTTTEILADTGKPGRVNSSPVLRHLVPNPMLISTNATTAGMWVPEGFAVDVVATEPEVTQPIAFTFDERGRIWIAEAHSYPRRQPDGQGKDRIIILEDTNGDGHFDKKVVFTTGLNLVSGLEVGFGGVWVGAAPHFLFIPDANRDDQPDGEPVVLLDGWGYGDTHETLNSFTWGPDGWLYGNHGVFNFSRIGKPEAPDSERVEMRAGVWRYHPINHTFEVFGTGCSNQWGIDFNETGEMFLTHCRSAWGKGSTSYMIRNGHYWNQANANHAPFISAGKGGWNYGKEEVFRNFLLAAARYGHGEGGAGAPGTRAIYGGHSHVGSLFYLGRNWPAQYRDQLFTHNLHGHQMNRELVQRSGSGYEVVNAGADHLYTPDPRFIGVDLKYGPDGAVYMIDWYDKQHCHTGNEEAWDRTDGRVYRMSWTATWQPVSVDLSKLSTQALVDMVTSRDEWESRMARRLLQERQDPSAISALQATLSRVKITPQKLRVLWALHILGTGTSVALLEDPDEVIRAWAIRMICEQGEIPADTFVRLAKTDPSARVQLALASALPDLDEANRWQVAEGLAARAEQADDFFLPKMIWYGLAPLALSDIPRGLAIAQQTEMPMLRDSITWYLGKQPAGRTALVNALADRSPEESTRILDLMAFAVEGSKNLPPPPGWSETAARLRSPSNDALLDRLGALFGDEAVIQQMQEQVVDDSLPLAKRKEMLSMIKERADVDVQLYLRLLGDQSLRSEVLPLLGRFDDPRVGKALLKQLPSLQGADRNTALNVLTGKPALARVLLDAVDGQQMPAKELTALHLRSLNNLGDEAIKTRVSKTWGTVNASSAQAPATISKYGNLFKQAKNLDAKAGEAAFTRVCAACHTINGQGANLGPDLSGSWSSGLDYFLENIIDPNAVVGENYQLNIVTLNDLSVVSGMPAEETDDILSIRTLTETVKIPKADIKERQVLSQSMMPPGLLDALPQEEALALLKFLTTE